MYKIRVSGEFYLKSAMGTEEKEFNVTLDVNLPLYKIIRDERSNREVIKPLFGRVLSHIRDPKLDLLTKAIRKEHGGGVRMAHKSTLESIEWHGGADKIQEYKTVVTEYIDDSYDKFKYSQNGVLTLEQRDAKRKALAELDAEVEFIKAMLPKTGTKKATPQTQSK